MSLETFSLSLFAIISRSVTAHSSFICTFLQNINCIGSFFKLLSRKCNLRRSTPTRPTSSSTSSRESSTPSSSQRSMARRWPTPVAWMKTLSLTTRNTVSSSDGTASSISEHYACSLLPPAALSRKHQTFRSFWRILTNCSWLESDCGLCLASQHFLHFIANMDLCKGLPRQQWSRGESTKLVHFAEPNKTTPPPPLMWTTHAITYMQHILAY